jgi:hypothetical protein
MLMKGGGVMVRALCRLMNVVWRREVVPAEWKKGQIVPIFKGGVVSKLGDYRGITLLSVVSKAMESVVMQRVSKWMEQGGKLSDEQGGFRAKRGTVDLIWLVSEVLQRRRERKVSTFACFVDVQKAYDTVWQEGLWKRLSDLGVKGKVWRLLREWYGDTRSVVLVEGVETREFALRQGVKQGAVLSPVLYAVFVDGVVAEMKRRGLGVEEGGVWVGVLLYADDMALMARSREELQQMMEVVVQYSQQWRFRLNAAKTKVMVVGEKKMDKEARAGQVWKLGGATVEEVKVFKYLGVELRADGRWTDVAKRLGDKAAAVASLLLGVGGACDRMGMGLRRRLWQCMGVPGMQYGVEVWDANQGEGEKLEKVQREAGRRVLGCSSRMSDEVVRGELGWLTARGRRDELRLRYLGRLLRMPVTRGVRQFLVVRTQDLEEGLGCGKGWCAQVAGLVEKYGLAQECKAGAGMKAAMWNKAVQAAVLKKEEEVWREAMAGKASLELYRRVKEGLWLEQYVDGGVKARKSAVLRTNLRGGCSELEVQVGKHMGLERQERVCRVCSGGVVEDEEHFLLNCPALQKPRASMWTFLQSQLADVRLERDSDTPVWPLVEAMTDREKVDLLLGASPAGWPGDALDQATQRAVWDLWRARKALVVSGGDRDVGRRGGIRATVL